MENEAYQYHNLIIVRNKLSGEGIHQIKQTLDKLSSKLDEVASDDTYNNLSVPFDLTPKDLLVCHIVDKKVKYYHVSKDINQIEHKIKYSDAVNVIDARLLYHATGIINQRAEKTIENVISQIKRK